MSGKALGVFLGAFGIAAFFSLGDRAVAQLKKPTGPGQDYVISVEDVLDVHVWKEPELTREVLVREDGKISIPLVDDIQAAGRTPVDLKKEITERLSQFLADPQVSVIVKAPRKYKVFVTGNVNRPGQYESPHAVTPLQAIAMAGGLNEWASSKLIVLSRENGKESRRVLNYKEVLSGEALEQNAPLKSGDTVIVP
ncbi:MAG: polysaccharide biosynthesis/export family protein [Thermodesulfobacteriota bacterium]